MVISVLAPLPSAALHTGSRNTYILDERKHKTSIRMFLPVSESYNEYHTLGETVVTVSVFAEEPHDARLHRRSNIVCFCHRCVVLCRTVVYEMAF